MDNPYRNLSGNQMTRNFGGRSRGSAEPLITGYHFIQFVNIPFTVVATYGNHVDGVSGRDKLVATDMSKILAASALSVTIPTSRLNHVDLVGLGGIKWTVPTNIDYDTTFNVKFLEFNHTPIFNIFHSWVKMIRDYRTGMSNIGGSVPNAGTYDKSNYSATVYYFTTTPNCSDINYYACFDGVYPVTDPHQLHGANLEEINKMEVDIEFKYDYLWSEPWVYDKCVKILSERRTKIGNADNTTEL